MPDPDPQAQELTQRLTSGPITADEAVASAARVLRQAELDTDLQKMKQLDEIAMTWCRLAELLIERDKV